MWKDLFTWTHCQNLFIVTNISFIISQNWWAKKKRSIRTSWRVQTDTREEENEGGWTDEEHKWNPTAWTHVWLTAAWWRWWGWGWVSPSQAAWEERGDKGEEWHLTKPQETDRERLLGTYETLVSLQKTSLAITNQWELLFLLKHPSSTEIIREFITRRR